MVGLCCFWVSRRRVGLGFESGLHIDRQGSNRGAMKAEKQKSHSEEWLNCLILLVPPNGIEPLPDDYKSTARPSCYGGIPKRERIIA